MLPGSLRRAVFGANLICNLINMFTEGENITNYFSKTLRGCRVNASSTAFANRDNTPCVIGADRGAYLGSRRDPIYVGCRGWATPPEPFLGSRSPKKCPAPFPCSWAVGHTQSAVADADACLRPSLCLLSCDTGEIHFVKVMSKSVFSHKNSTHCYKTSTSAFRQGQASNSVLPSAYPLLLPLALLHADTGRTP